MGTWYCQKCYKNMGDNQYCPYCGAHRLGDMAMSEEAAKDTLTGFWGRRQKVKKKSQPMFSDIECLMYGIYPDEEVKKFLEYRVLTTDHSKQ